MRLIKNYTDFRLNENNTFPTDREEIIGHLKALSKTFNVADATIHEDGTVDIEGNFSVSGSWSKLPVKFGRIGGVFSCRHVGLTSLEGCPSSTQHFLVTGNQLTNLKGISKSLNGAIDISINKLTSLEGLPEDVNGSIWAHSNKLTSFKGGPKIVRGDLLVGWNNFSDLEGFPEEITGDLDLRWNQNLTSLKGLPSKIDGRIMAMGLPNLYIMDKYEGTGEIKFASDEWELSHDGVIGSYNDPDGTSPIQQVCQLFHTNKDFNDSLDYKYFKMVGDQPAIIEWRFRQALEEFDLPFPVNPSGWGKSSPNAKDLGLFYIYIDDEGNRLTNVKGVTPYNNRYREDWEEENHGEDWEDED